MRLEGKELGGKNIFFVKRDYGVAMYFHKTRIGEILTTEENSVTSVSIWHKKYIKYMVFYLDVNKKFDFFNLQKFPLNFYCINYLKERFPPNKLLYFAIKIKALSLVNFALEREAELTKTTFIEAARHSNVVLQIHLKNNVSYPEEGMLAALESRNYAAIKTLAKKIISVEKYIEMVAQKEKHIKIKDILVKELARRYKARNKK